jgi:hypothetical protein
MIQEGEERKKEEEEREEEKQWGEERHPRTKMKAPKK